MVFKKYIPKYRCLRSEKSIAQLLGKNSGKMAKVLGQINQISALQAYITTYFAEHCKQTVQVANLRQGVLILSVSNASLATQLRYQSMALLSELRQQAAWAGIRSIKFIVASQRGTTNYKLAKTKRTPLVSKPNAAMLKQTALTIKNPKLRKQLLRLSGE